MRYTQQVAVSRSLLHREILSMNATATIECQTLDVKSSATELGVCEETVRRLVRRKVIRKLPGLRRVLIPRTELDRYMSNGNTMPASHETHCSNRTSTDARWSKLRTHENVR